MGLCFSDNSSSSWKKSSAIDIAIESEKRQKKHELKILLLGKSRSATEFFKSVASIFLRDRQY